MLMLKLRPLVQSMPLMLRAGNFTKASKGGYLLKKDLAFTAGLRTARMRHSNVNSATTSGVEEV